MTQPTQALLDKLQILLKKSRAILKWITFGYLIVLLGLIMMMRWAGERNWITATAIYLPPTSFLLPLGLLVPICLLLNRRLLWFCFFAVVIVFGLYQTPDFSFSHDSAGQKIKVVTNNVGERKPGSVTPFVSAFDPDIIAFQEARNRDKFLRREYPNKFVAVHDEFALVSKWPIKGVGFVPGLFSHYGYAAAWFEVDCGGKSLIIYNIHMPTPRPDFLRLRGKGFLASLVRWEGIYSGSVRSNYKKCMQDRVEEGQKLAEMLSKETRPFLAVGDYNMPDTGYLYRLFNSRFTDVFAAKGKGYGLTFPGFTRNPLSLFGPWLRIDYIFASKQWTPLNCRVESRQNAQHLAVAAELEWNNK